MNHTHDPQKPAALIAAWADRLRDLSAAGLKYADNEYDRARYEELREMAVQMLALATGQTFQELAPLKDSLFTRMSPVVAGTAAVIDAGGRILLMRRSDNHLWNMPGGQMEVGETPAQAVVRETLEETGVRCVPVALSGVYDSRIWDNPAAQHVYKFTFLCRPEGEPDPAPSHAHEVLETGWFAENELPADLYEGHVQRVADAYRAWRGDLAAHFDQ